MTQILETDDAAILVLRAVQSAYKIKAAFAARNSYLEYCKGSHCLLDAEAKQDLEKATSKFITAQVKSAAGRLKEIKWNSRKSADSARNLASLVFNPREWDLALVRALAPVLVKNYFKAAMNQLDIMQQGARVAQGKSANYLDIKESTATRWLRDHPEYLNSEIIDAFMLDTAYGTVAVNIGTEFPEWMKKSILDHLKETFAKPFWEDINNSTFNDISKTLEEGLTEGWSINDMAKVISDELIDDPDYAMVRAKNIARTESGHALNAARTESYNQLKAEIGEELPIQKSWLSVLGPTTRETHANLDGVPADKNGMWNLSGIQTRWPGDVNLPANERCNCQCSIITEFGMLDAEAQDLIAEYEERVAEAQAAKLASGKSYRVLDSLNRLSKFILELKDSSCGAGAPGRPGFQPNNTCAREGGARDNRPSMNDEKLKFESKINNDPELSSLHESVLEIGKNSGVDEADKEVKNLVKISDTLSEKQISARMAWKNGTGSGNDYQDISNEYREAVKKSSEAYGKYNKLLKERNEKVWSLLEVPEEDRIEIKLSVRTEDYSNTGQDFDRFSERVNEAKGFLERITHHQRQGSVYASVIMEDKKYRENYDHKTKIVRCNYASPVSVVVHELGHALEDRMALVGDHFRELRRSQVAGVDDSDRASLVSMSAKFPDLKYKDNEYGMRDSFEKLFGEGSPSAYYTGKLYRDTNLTEIISMGVEALHKDPIHFAKSDPEYFKFIVGVLRGKFKRWNY